MCMCIICIHLLCINIFISENKRFIPIKKDYFRKNTVKSCLLSFAGAIYKKQDGQSVGKVLQYVFFNGAV